MVVNMNTGNRHGLSRDRFYRCWKGIIRRCTVKQQFNKKYTDKNIKVCKRWHEFENFKADMLPTYKPNLSIDRIDNNGDYKPSNCRWATRQTQAENRDCVIKVIFNDEVMSMTRFGRALGYRSGNNANYYYKMRGEAFLLENGAKLLK